MVGLKLNHVSKRGHWDVYKGDMDFAIWDRPLAIIPPIVSACIAWYFPKHNQSMSHSSAIMIGVSFRQPPR